MSDADESDLGVLCAAVVFVADCETEAKNKLEITGSIHILDFARPAYFTIVDSRGGKPPPRSAGTGSSLTLR